jgi:ABC-type amino acid transport substrate-binding protein
MCIDPNWMPFEKYEAGEHIGITNDYFKILEKKIHKEIKLIPTKSWNESLKYAKERKCDILSLAMKTPLREEYLNFTKPYITTPLVVSTKIESPFIDDFGQLSNKKIGITKGYALGELLKTKYPNIDFVDVLNIEDGLNKIHQGKIYGYIDGLINIGYEIQKNHIGQLKISAKLNEKWELGIASRNDIPLLKISNDNKLNISY